MSAGFDAFHLPVPVDGPFRTLRAGALEVRYPEPRDDLLAEVARRVSAAGEKLAGRPAADIIGAIDAAAARMADPGDPVGAEAQALLPAATGYSAAMIRLVLERMTADWRAPALEELLETELGGTAVLDRFVRRGADSTTTAIGPCLAFHVFSGNVPGVAVTSLVRALLVKAPSIGKLAAGEPVLPVLFARALASVDPTLGDALAVTYWPGGDSAAEAAVLDAADTVIVYGGHEAVADLTRRVPPHKRLVVHGPKLSLAAIGRGPLEGGLEGAAARAARAVATVDQQGCVSPHSIWVEGPDDRAAAVAGMIAAELDRLEGELPRGALTPAEASAIHQERGSAELRSHADPRVRVWAGSGTAWTVVLEPADDLRASCLNRFVRVHPIDDLDRLPAIISAAAPHIQSVALEGAGDRDPRLARHLARAGARRITTLDRLPWPPAHAHHDGAPPLRELLRWTDREK